METIMELSEVKNPKTLEGVQNLMTDPRIQKKIKQQRNMEGQIRLRRIVAKRKVMKGRKLGRKRTL
jgi:hypothetical protein